MGKRTGTRLNPVFYSAKTTEWETPVAIFEELNKRFGPFDLDPCATPGNAKCAKYFTVEDNGLSVPWFGRVFMNPPYGRAIKPWIEKAYQESLSGVVVVCLLPARTDTS